MRTYASALFSDAMLKDGEKRKIVVFTGPY